MTSKTAASRKNEDTPMSKAFNAMVCASRSLPTRSHAATSELTLSARRHAPIRRSRGR